MKPNNPFPRPTKETVATEEGFLYWTWEREAVRLARENGHPAPWTDDEVLQKYRFCNVRRRDDRVSRWLIDNVYTERSEHVDLWFYAAICRYVNWPPAIQKLKENGVFEGRVEQFHPKKFADVIDRMTKNGEKAWTGAYVTYPGHEGAGHPKGYRTAKYILEPLKIIAADVRDAIQDNRVEGVVKALSGSYGWSTFSAGQAIADLTYFPEQLGNASDLRSWAPLGPGSQGCLNAIYGHTPTKVWDQGHFNIKLRHLQGRIENELGISDLTLHDTQNCACEVYKYIKAVKGTGKPRNQYRPETAF